MRYIQQLLIEKPICYQWLLSYHTISDAQLSSKRVTTYTWLNTFPVQSNESIVIADRTFLLFNAKQG